MSDVHLSDMKFDTGSRVLTNSYELLDDSISQINKIKNLDFVFVTGDMTNSPDKETIQKFDSKMNTLKAPWYAAFGNHDISVFGGLSKKDYIEILQKNNKNFKFSSPYYSFSPKKSFRVIVLDSIIDDEITTNGRLDKKQLIWLDKELALAQKRGEIPLIFLHNPLLPPIKTFAGPLSKFNHELRNPKDFYAVLNKYKMPVAIFSGHYHISKIKKENNILHVSSPSLICYPNAFRVIEISQTKDKVVFRIRTVNSGLFSIREKAKSLLKNPEKLEGNDSDQNADVVMDK